MLTGWGQSGMTVALCRRHAHTVSPVMRPGRMPPDRYRAPGAPSSRDEAAVVRADWGQAAMPMPARRRGRAPTPPDFASGLSDVEPPCQAPGTALPLLAPGPAWPRRRERPALGRASTRAEGGRRPLPAPAPGRAPAPRQGRLSGLAYALEMPRSRVPPGAATAPPAGPRPRPPGDLARAPKCARAPRPPARVRRRGAALFACDGPRAAGWPRLLLAEAEPPRRWDRA